MRRWSSLALLLLQLETCSSSLHASGQSAYEMLVFSCFFKVSIHLKTFLSSCYLSCRRLRCWSSPSLPCYKVTHPAWQNKSAHSTADDVDIDVTLRASNSGPLPLHTPCPDTRVQLTREQSADCPPFIRNHCSKNPLVDTTGDSRRF